MNLNAAVCKAGSNKNNDRLTTHRACQLRRTDFARKPAPVTQSQAALIVHLKNCLDEAGVDYSFILEPQTNKAATHVINALIRLARNHGVETRKERRNPDGS